MTSVTRISLEPRQRGRLIQWAQDAYLVAQQAAENCVKPEATAEERAQLSARVMDLADIQRILDALENST